jgi:phage gp29-like protein
MVDQPVPPRPDFGELAAAGDANDTTGWLVDELAAPRDEILRTRGGGNLDIYERLRRDDQVASCWQQRTRGAIAREWFVEPGGTSSQDEAAADFLRQQLQSVNFDRVTAKMMNGVFYGYAVGECLYRANGGRIELAGIKVRRAKRFRWGRDGSLRLLRPDKPRGEAMPPNKFWAFSAGAEDDDDLYGLGLGHFLYWPVWFKRNGLKFWALYLEKFAMPTAVGVLPGGSGPEERRKLLAALKAITGDSAVVLPQGVDAKLMEATRQSGGDYEVFYGLMDAAIAKIILSQTMTTDNGSSLSQAQVHADVKMEVVKSDNDLICESFNVGPAAWLTAWNFPGAAVPRVWRDHSEPEDMKVRAERDEKVYGMGYEPTPEYVTETYGAGWVKRPAGSPAQTVNDIGPLAPAVNDGQVASFAEEIDGDAADQLTPQLAQTAQPAVDGLVAELKGLIDSADSLEAVRELLLAKSIGMDVDELAAAIGEAMVLADLQGRADIEAG